MIKIKDGFIVPEDELSFTFPRSSKSGGQNVNKISSRVTSLMDKFLLILIATGNTGDGKIALRYANLISNNIFEICESGGRVQG